MMQKNGGRRREVSGRKRWAGILQPGISFLWCTPTSPRPCPFCFPPFFPAVIFLEFAAYSQQYSSTADPYLHRPEPCPGLYAEQLTAKSLQTGTTPTLETVMMRLMMVRGWRERKGDIKRARGDERMKRGPVLQRQCRGNTMQMQHNAVVLGGGTADETGQGRPRDVCCCWRPRQC